MQRMKVWLFQSVLSPYRIPLFSKLSDEASIQEFRLILLSDKFRTRPQWKRDVTTLPFKVQVPLGFGFQTGPEHEYCINPFIFFTMAISRPEVVICGGFSLATLFTALYAISFRKQYIIWTEATLLTDGRIGGARLMLRRWMARHAAAFIDAGTLAREYIRRLLPNVHESKLFRAYNCVENNSFAISRSEGVSRVRCNGITGRCLLFVGKLNDRKGLPELLNCYELLLADFPDLGLILIGDGPMADEIVRLKEKKSLRNLKMLGFLKNEEAAGYFSGADAFMLLSKRDHNPLVLFEALAAGIPVICSYKVGNSVDFIRNGENGYSVNTNDLQSVVERTAEVLRWDEQQRRACHSYAQQSVGKANYESATAAFLSAIHFAAGVNGPDLERQQEQSIS